MKPLAILLFLSMSLLSTAEELKYTDRIIINDRIEKVKLVVPESDRIQGPDFIAMQHEVLYYNSEGQIRMASPNDVKRIEFLYEGQMIRLESVPNVFRSALEKYIEPRIFIRLHIDGKLKLYSFSIEESLADPINDNNYEISVKKYYYLKKDDSQFKKVGNLSVETTLQELIFDCPHILSLLYEKKLKRKDITQIITQYNAECGMKVNEPLR